MLSNKQRVSKNVKIWIHVGAKNNGRFINVSEMYVELSSELCSALLSFHAFERCNFNPALFKKGRTKPLIILRSNEVYVNAFPDMSMYPNWNFAAALLTVEKYVFHFYGWKKWKKFISLV